MGGRRGERKVSGSIEEGEGARGRDGGREGWKKVFVTLPPVTDWKRRSGRGEWRLTWYKALKVLLHPVHLAPARSLFSLCPSPFLSFSPHLSCFFPFPASSHLSLLSIPIPPFPLSVPAGTSIIQVTATDADDPTYGNSAKLVYTLVQGQQYFSVDPQTGECVYISVFVCVCVCSHCSVHGQRNVKDAQMSES